MTLNLGEFIPEQGMAVYGSDGEKIGEIDTVEQDYFVVRKGFFFPKDHYIPMNTIESFEDRAVYLGYTSDQVLEQQWDTPPVATDTARSEHLERDQEPFPHDQDTQRTHVHEDDHLRVDIHEEELVARRRSVDRGDVGITTHVIEEEQSIDVPVTEERVEVTRRTVERDIAPDDDAFVEGTVKVPVHGEAIDVQKQARVTEEIDIDTVAEQHTERVSDTVRREEVRIEDDDLRREFDENGSR